jgi:cysteinylglycine-S-conjugate dipeptidase
VSQNSSVAAKVAALAAEHLPRTLSRLAEYLSVPAISCEPEHAPDVRRLCERLRADLTGLGFSARVCDVPGALPLVAAEWMGAGKDRPTLLIYGHLDLQPVRGEAWSSPPHQATRRGDRLYARGAADDMAGWVSHLAAVEAWFEVTGGLPMNVKWVLECEEEIGSPNLERYMDTFPEVFTADVMVLTDCENPAVDIPGLTTSLRGLLEVKLTCRALESDVHSGIWGNLAPDPALSLIQLLARLVDESGRFKLLRQELSAAERAHLQQAPLGPEVVRSGARLLPGVEPLPLEGRVAAEWGWRQPALTVLSTTFPPPGSEKNAIRASVAATLSIRLAPGQVAAEMVQALEAELLRDPPGGIQVKLDVLPGGARSWRYEPKGPAFAAADRAYVKAWGRPLMHIGIGGSIPFVALFGRRFSHLPLILNGVMDPETGAHGPNESLHLGVFEKAVQANVYLLDELSALPRG